VVCDRTLVGLYTPGYNVPAHSRPRKGFLPVFDVEQRGRGSPMRRMSWLISPSYPKAAALMIRPHFSVSALCRAERPRNVCCSAAGFPGPTPRNACGHRGPRALRAPRRSAGRRPRAVFPWAARCRARSSYRSRAGRLRPPWGYRARRARAWGR
jgi:hypothetical protein